jgi:long-chain acyl-CoA synthetase
MNLADIIDPHDADAVALISRGRPTTYGELRDQVARFRGGLVAAGVTAGDRVALLCANGPSFVVSYLAAVGLGAAVTPLNPMSPAPELAAELAAVGASLAVVDQVGESSWGMLIGTGTAPSVGTVVSSGGIAGAVAFDDLLRAEPCPSVDVEPDHLAVLMFTSGTAGAPRAAMLSHRNLLSNIGHAQTSPGHIRAGDVVYGVLPMFHIFGLNVVLGVSLTVGATLVLVQRFDPSTALDTIRDRHVTVVPGAPPMWTDFARLPDVPADAFSTVRLALTGAAKMPTDATEDLRERFGLELAEGYGLTEASPVVSSSAGLPIRPGSVGRVVDGVEVRLVDEDGDDALEGDAGEVWVRGPNVFMGYLDDPEATARVLTPDGWLRTGDVATVDEDGYLYLVDRVKDLIIVSGFNVYPAEVEDVLLEHPGVAEAGVVGVAHPHTGEAVKAYVVARRGVDLDEEALVEFCHERLARYKCPGKVLVVDELPRNVSGKLLRRELA